MDVGWLRIQLSLATQVGLGRPMASCLFHIRCTGKKTESIFFITDANLASIINSYLIRNVFIEFKK